MRLDRSKEDKVYRPKSIAELEQIILQTDEKLTFVAGSTDLMVQGEEWEVKKNIVDLTSTLGLCDDISISNKGMRIGASVRMSEIINHQIIRKTLPIFIEALKQIGSAQIQNRATLGGNIANASPAADSLPVLNVLDAQLWIGPRINSEFQKRKLDQIMVGPGETTLLNNQYIAYIFIPFLIKENLFWYFRKVGQRGALAISKLSLAVLGWYKDGKIYDIRISAGAVSAQVRRAYKTENVLNNNGVTDKLITEAREMLENEISPIKDIRSNIEYRKHICGELLRDALNQLKKENNK
jgi:CO/xanthine dehydrogenase FAD-binding subunit